MRLILLQSVLIIKYNNGKLNNLFMLMGCSWFNIYFLLFVKEVKTRKVICETFIDRNKPPRQQTSIFEFLIILGIFQ